MAKSSPDLPPTNGENGVKPPVSYSVQMNGGNDTYSYSKNSYYQGLSSNTAKEKMEMEILEKLDVKNLLTVNSNTVRIADLGCATGPNTYRTMETAIKSIKQKLQIQSPNSPTNLEFQVFFNDQVMNDFNTLFVSLPEDRDYFAAGVPGSFFGRLFPESCLHFVHSSFALHWLSKLPEELRDESSTAWNKGRIHYTSAPDEVLKAYGRQFAQDMEVFLDARAKEIVSGGMMVMIMSGIPKDMPYSYIPNGMMYDFMASILLDLANEGMIKESQVDSFNMPYYAATPEEMKEIVDKNGCFIIDSLELRNPASWLVQGQLLDFPFLLNHVRASMEDHLSKHFGPEIMDDFFQRLLKLHEDNSEIITSRCQEKVLLFVVLRRI